MLLKLSSNGPNGHYGIKTACTKHDDVHQAFPAGRSRSQFQFPSRSHFPKIHVYLEILDWALFMIRMMQYAGWIDSCNFEYK